jgi:hypothetical protein
LVSFRAIVPEPCIFTTLLSGFFIFMASVAWSGSGRYRSKNINLSILGGILDFSRIFRTITFSCEKFSSSSNSSDVP